MKLTHNCNLYLKELIRRKAKERGLVVENLMSKDMAAADMLFLQCFSLDFAPWAALKKKLTQTAWRETVLQVCFHKL